MQDTRARPSREPPNRSHATSEHPATFQSESIKNERAVSLASAARMRHVCSVPRQNCATTLAEHAATERHIDRGRVMIWKIERLTGEAAADPFCLCVRSVSVPIEMLAALPWQGIVSRQFTLGNSAGSVRIKFAKYVTTKVVR
jgi:hypothetical protein